MQGKGIQILALGDSYTFGEGVPVGERFIDHVANHFHHRSVNIEKLEVIAKTGWTSGDLLAHIKEFPPTSTAFDLVFLLIGVNDQYQKKPIEGYVHNFGQLLDKAISLSRRKEKGVCVLSIPDYGLTPFAKDMDVARISAEIESFNLQNRSEVEKRTILYVNVTDISRLALSDPALLADDGLHPSGKMYARWAEKIIDSGIEKLLEH